jgi:hypothetical protein
MIAWNARLLSMHIDSSPIDCATSASVETDADFTLEIMWTDWQAPKYLNNAENPVLLTKSDFAVKRHEIRETGGGTKELTLDLEGIDIPLFARLTYQLQPHSFYIRRRLAVTDTSGAGHFLQNICPLAGLVSGKPSIVKGGGFGQPIALAIDKTGVSGCRQCDSHRHRGYSHPLRSGSG